jgi:hypothetical protein
MEIQAVSSHIMMLKSTCILSCYLLSYYVDTIRIHRVIIQDVPSKPMTFQPITVEKL